MESCIKAKVRLVGLRTVDTKSAIKVCKGKKLRMDTDPEYFEVAVDKFAVNVFANEG
jgi:hypothetical protein